MGRAAQIQSDWRLAFHVDGLGAFFQVHPLPFRPHLLGVGGVGLFCNQIDIVVLEHRQAPAELGVVP